MSSIFPLRDNVSLDDEREPRLVEIDEDTADEVFEALSSSTTRQIFLELHDAPQTASDLADVTETSVQNVQYHLGKLQDADLIEVVDTWYSERGSEMKVYAPQDESLVLFAGRDKTGTLRSLLNRLVGVLALLIPTSVLAGLAAGGGTFGLDGLFGGASEQDSGGERATAGGNGNGNGGGDDGGEESFEAAESTATEAETEDVSVQNAEPTPQATDGPVPEATAEETETVVEADTVSQTADVNETVAMRENGTEVATDGGTEMTPADAVDGAAEATAGIDPALAAAVAFFVGGLFVFTALVLWYGSPDNWG